MVYLLLTICIKLLYLCRVSSCRCSLLHCQLTQMLSYPIWWVFRQILKKPKPPLEANHCLIRRKLPPKCVCSLEIGEEGIYERSQLVEGVVTRLPLWNALRAVIEVKKLHEEGKPITTQDRAEGGGGKRPRCDPVIC